MTITTTVAGNAGFIPEIWAQRALSILRGKITLAKIVSRDTDYAPFAQGKTLNIPYPGTLKGRKKAAGSNTNIQTPQNGTSIPVTLSEHAYCDFKVEDVAAAQANTVLMDRFIDSAIVGVAEQLEADLFKAALGFGTSVGTYGTSLSQAVTLQAMQKLNEAKIDTARRHLIMPPKDLTNILDDDKIRNYIAFQKGSALEKGELAELDGFMLHMSQLVPTGAIITFTGSPTGGTYTLTIPALGTDSELTTVTSANITYAASQTAASVQSTLEGLSGVGVGNISVTGANGGPFTVRPIGALAGSPSGVSVANTGLTGGTSPDVTRTVIASGVALHEEALILVTRPMMDPPGQTGVQASTIVDQESGLTIRVLYTYDMAARSVVVGFDILYGVAKVRDAGGLVVKT